MTTPNRRINLPAHFNQVEYSTLAIFKPPITTPDVGVNRLIKPDAAEKIITITAGLWPNSAVRGPMIGIVTDAQPEVEGIKNDNPKYNKYEAGAYTTPGTFAKADEADDKIQSDKPV